MTYLGIALLGLRIGGAVVTILAIAIAGTSELIWFLVARDR